MTPRARRNAIDGVGKSEGGPVLKVAVTAPPEDGKANTAVIKLLAKTFGVAKSALAVTGGAKSRNKTVSVTGDAATLQAVIMALETHKDAGRSAGGSGDE